MKIDAKGKACPIPVIMAKKELDKGTQDLSIVVDGDTQVQNLKRLGDSYGRKISASPEGDKMLVMFEDGDGTIPDTAHSYSEGSFAIFFNKQGVGTGDDELAQNLGKMAIYTLSEGENIPSYICFMNGGVKLTTGIVPQIVEDLKTLEEKGTKILVCGTCLNYFDMSDKCQVGTVSNMYDILTALEDVEKVITM